MHSCDLNSCMSSIKSTARLTAVCSKDQLISFDKHQIPINIDENLTLKLQIDNSCFTCNPYYLKKNDPQYERFLKTYQKLTNEELTDALNLPLNQIKDYILHNVPCIGCRTSIDNFMKTLIEHHHSSLEPLILNENNSITLSKTYCSNPENIYILFFIHGSKLNTFIESIPKSKKNRRCNIHSLDKWKSLSDWGTVWDVMNKECRDELTLVEADCLLDTIENYLRKYKFCSECKVKVLEAYELLLDNSDDQHQDRRGFRPSLYEGLQACTDDKHIHIDCNKEFIGSLIARAECEIQDTRRERHAKTLDIAQEEILTCIGIYLFERFDKIYRTMRSEEQTWQLLFYICVDCLRLNFEKAIDRKQDFSATLEILCQEFRNVDQKKTPKKRSKRKNRRQNKTNETSQNEMVEKTDFSDNILNNNKQEKVITRRRTSSCCSCLCHYNDQRSNSLSIIETTVSSNRLIKSHSCPSSLLFTTEQMINRIPIQLSGSLETLLLSVSTRECVCHEKTSEQQQVLCDECPISSSSTSCIQCFNTRTDLGYSSEQDETSSFGPCECVSTACDVCLTDLSYCCPLHEEDESNESILSSGIYSHNCCNHNKYTDYPKTIELYDSTRKNKVKLELISQYPFFNMDLKQIWDEVPPSTNIENEIFISDHDLEEFLMLNKSIDIKRAQIRDTFKLKFQTWKQRQSHQI